jgi:hypothetical protein
MSDGLITDDITAVQGRFRFDQDDVNLVFGQRQMINSTGDDHEFSRADSDLAVAVAVDN